MQQTLNAVIYARYSSHNQTEQSIEGQLRDCYAFAERQGLQVVGEYIDRAITGRTDERPDFQRMIADAKKQQFQRVIVWKFDRFSRDRYDSAIYKHKLKQCGVKVLSAMENVGEGEVGIILEALLEASAEQYSLDLSKKVVRGQRESRMKGVFLGGYVPLGYKLENRKLVEDENTAPIARYIFEEYAKGVPKKKIVDALNARGLKNSKGLPFALSTVHSVLKNKKYIGIYEHGGEEVAGGCDALIDERTFYKVQELMDKRKAAPAASKATVEYLLQGKLYCGHCGTNMIAEAGHGKNGKIYHYYTCRKRRREHTCDKKNEKKGYIEWYVVEQTVEYVLTPERIEYIAAQLVAQYKKDCGLDRIQAYEKQLNRIDAEISRLVDTLAVCPASARQPIFDKMEQLDTEKAAAELDLAKLRISAKVQLTEEQIVEWLKQFCNGDALDIDFQKRIIDTFINSVYLYDDKVVIYYNIKGGKQVSYIDMLDSTEEPPFSEDAQASSGCSVLNCPAQVDVSDTEVPGSRLGRGGFRFIKAQRMNFYIVGQVVLFARITGDGGNGDLRLRLWCRGIPKIRLFLCQLFFWLCRFVGESVQLLLVEGAQGNGNRLPAFIHRCQYRFIFPQNLHFHAVCGGSVIRRISGFQLHSFHCTGKPLGKMLGDSRIACAAS